MNILLDYFFKVTAIIGAQAASTAFLKQVLVVAKPKSGQSANVGTIYTCTSTSDVAARTDNTESTQLFNAGMGRVYLLLADNLDIADFIEGNQNFFTILISSDFSDAEIELAAAHGTVTITSYANLLTTTPDTVTIAGVAFTAQAGAATEGTATFQAATSNNATAASLAAQINAHPVVSLSVIATVLNAIVTITAVEEGVAGNAITTAYADLGSATIGATVQQATLAGGAGLEVGTFKGVVGTYTNDKTKAAARNAVEKRCCFYATTSTKAKNMFYAFGKMLSNASDWKNQQFITMPYADDVDSIGEAEALFDDRISFVMDDEQYGKRLGFFAAGGKAIVAPYVMRNLEIDLQSRALTYVTANQPAYTPTQAALLEDECSKVIDNSGDGIPGYIQKGWILSGSIQITLEAANFVATGDAEVQDAGAMWRVFVSMIQT